MPEPDVGDHDVLIRVRATAVNMWDLRYRKGMLPPPLPGRPGWPLPFQLGRDAAGEVVAVGAAVEKWSVGQRVVQMPHPACGGCPMCSRGADNLCINTAYPGHQIFGGYAQLITRPEDAILGIPDGVSFEKAAATLWSYTTPMNCARRRAPVGVGDTVVITGASGGLATAAAQIARLCGATVIGTTTKPARRAALINAGFDHIVDSAGAEAPDEIRALTGGLGADAVWDSVGGSSFLALASACTRLGGKIAILGAPLTETGSALSTNAQALVFGELDIVGVRGATRDDQRRCVDLLSDGKIDPVIARAFPLNEAADAHEFVESQQHIGKVLLIPEHS
ncbi:quinone oxidoreductase family protein [Mycobacterium deserti]|uniref:Alcohol dehydrogenase catalytic domain-containing protein n=1 Tax=Mycobacterium deserti TaxID=2978347 RepID=A0ABT2MEL7_9MYCO|nr:alcohol dehydrogenase catalytic domain-containing protein [Mycobacterium deserti]MCT7660728.1 alcohol dehydrogenase catalytic domain-containing protein [Mycobacterium deserti]